MKDHGCTFACAPALVTAMAIALIACGGRQTMASKSAAAYDEAKRKGIPIEAGEHGGHSTNATPEETARVTDAGHASMPGMDDSTIPGVDRSRMTAAKQHSPKAGMNPSTMPGMQHGSSGPATHEMAGMDHSPMAGMASSKRGGTQRGGSAAAGHSMAG